METKKSKVIDDDKVAEDLGRLVHLQKLCSAIQPLQALMYTTLHDELNEFLSKDNIVTREEKEIINEELFFKNYSEVQSFVELLNNSTAEEIFGFNALLIFMGKNHRIHEYSYGKENGLEQDEWLKHTQDAVYAEDGEELTFHVKANFRLQAFIDDYRCNHITVDFTPEKLITYAFEEVEWDYKNLEAKHY